MLLEDVTSREHTRMNSLGPCCVEFLVKLVRTALMCKFNINPSESSLLPVPAYRLGLSPSQQDLLCVCTILMSVVAGGTCCLHVCGLESPGAVPGICLLLLQQVASSADWAVGEGSQPQAAL